MTEIDRLISTAESQIGVAEDPRGSNRVPYNTAYYGREVSGSAYPWCMVFVWWCFREAGLSRLFYDGGKTASCTALMRWAKQEGRWVAGDYRRGDVLLFRFDNDDYMDHCGICTGRSGDRWVAVEGNTNDEVRRVERDAAVIAGAYRPPWQDAEPDGPHVTVSLRELSCGDTGETVKALQLLLQGYGFDCGVYGADGDFGRDTESAMKRFQRARGLDADGVCGEKTWSALLGC